MLIFFLTFNFFASFKIPRESLQKSEWMENPNRLAVFYFGSVNGGVFNDWNMEYMPNLNTQFVYLKIMQTHAQA